MRLKQTLFALLLAASIAAVPAGADAEGGANNVVLATATADGSELSRSGLQVAPAGGDTVTSTNLAKATSLNCTGCRTVAVALQAVLITRGAHTITPTNAAVATNAGCSACASYAFAYQYVITTDGPVYVSLDGRQETADLRSEIAAIAASGASFDQLTTRLDDVAARFKAIIDEDLQSAGRPASGAATTRVSTAPAG